MTLLSSFICRLGGHKPYEHPHVVWERWTFGNPHAGRMMMIKRCKRCGAELSRRPMSPEDEQIEA